MRNLWLKLDTIADIIRSACLLEAAARKAGNVHPAASFSDLTFADFEVAADLTAEAMADIANHGVGKSVLNAVRAVRLKTGTNVNLGITLLIAPLGAVPPEKSLDVGISEVLSGLDLVESEYIYEAIRLAQPGGMGQAEDQDISQPPTRPIRYAMSLARDRDLIARQYCNDFDDILKFGTKTFLRWANDIGNWENAVIGTQLEILKSFPDSLIARKCGAELATEVSSRAETILDWNWPHSRSGLEAFSAFDSWLRSDGHRLNPGTTADMIAAILFATIRDQMWTPPEVIEVNPLTPSER